MIGPSNNSKSYCSFQYLKTELVYFDLQEEEFWSLCVVQSVLTILSTVEAMQVYDRANKCPPLVLQNISGHVFVNGIAKKKHSKKKM